MNKLQRLNDGTQAVYVGNDTFFSLQKFGKNLEQYKRKFKLWEKKITLSMTYINDRAIYYFVTICFNQILKMELIPP